MGLLPSLLKPENGPIGSTLNGWLDGAASGRATWIFVLLFVIVGTAFQAISSASVGIDPASLEVYAWGQHPSAGYYAQPPLCALIAAGWFSVFPATDLSFHLLAMVNAAIGLYGVDLIARRCLDGDKRLFVLLFLLLTPFYQFHADRFVPDEITLSTWPIATYCLLRAVDTHGLAWSVRSGATAALALLGDYYSIFLLAGFLAAVVVSPGRDAYLRSTSPWISAITAGILLAPHIQWLSAAGFAPLASAAAHVDAPLIEVLWNTVLYVAGDVCYLALPMAVYWIATGPDWPTLREALWPSDRDARRLVVLLATPLVLAAVTAPAIGAAPAPPWTGSGWFLLPVLLLRPPDAKLPRVAAIRTAALVASAALGALFAAPALAWHYHAVGTKDGREFCRPVAAEVSRAWHYSVGLPLRIVMGNPDLVAATGFYGPDHPDSVPDFDLEASPWVTPQRIQSEGWAAVCAAEGHDCVDEAKRRAAGKDGVSFINFRTTNRYFGSTGKLGRFVFIVVPPQPAPRPLR